MSCPMCGSVESRWTAVLGTMEHSQCRDCGMVSNRVITDLEDGDSGPMDDPEMFNEIEELRNL
jgi:uncharacterized Zn finger protein